MHGPALRAWERQHCGTAWFAIDNGHLVLDRIDGPTNIVRLNPDWLRAQGYGHHVEDDGATIRIGDHVFRRVRALRDPIAAYELDAGDVPSTL